MWAIVGLGNPGKRYLKTRHNVGFMVVDELMRRRKVEPVSKGSSIEGVSRIGEAGVVLLKPMTFMNLSGGAVKALHHRFPSILENLIVIHDDLDIAKGRIKIKKGGKSGGHRGIQSIIDAVGSTDFIRIKIGIGRDPALPSEVYVLQNFAKDEMDRLGENVYDAANAVEDIIVKGIDQAMNTYNRNPL